MYVVFTHLTFYFCSVWTLLSCLSNSSYMVLPNLCAFCSSLYDFAAATCLQPPGIESTGLYFNGKHPIYFLAFLSFLKIFTFLMMLVLILYCIDTELYCIFHKYALRVFLFPKSCYFFPEDEVIQGYRYHVTVLGSVMLKRKTAMVRSAFLYFPPAPHEDRLRLTHSDFMLPPSFLTIRKPVFISALFCFSFI